MSDEFTEENFIIKVQAYNFITGATINEEYEYVPYLDKYANTNKLSKVHGTGLYLQEEIYNLKSFK